MKKQKSLAFVLAVVMCLGITLPVSAASVENGPDEAAKQSCYAEYEKIVKEVNKETGAAISLAPIESFQNDWWYAPEEYRSLLIEFAHADIGMKRVSPPGSETSQVQLSVTIGQTTYTGTVKVSGVFTTDLNPLAHAQGFAECVTVFSELSIPSEGLSWSHRNWKSPEPFYSSDRSLCTVTVHGRVWVIGASKPATITAFFGCLPIGTIHGF